MCKWSATAAAHAKVKPSDGSKCECTTPRSKTALSISLVKAKVYLSPCPRSRRTWESLKQISKVTFFKKAHVLVESAREQLMLRAIRSITSVAEVEAVDVKEIADAVEFSVVLSALLEAYNVSAPAPEGSRSSHDIIMCELGQCAEREVAKSVSKAAAPAQR
jgi:RNase P/RNase MRP subunit p30